MSFSQGSRSGLAFIKEVTFGVTPAGNMTDLPFTTHSLDLTKERVQGNDIQPDRMPRHDRHGNKGVGGDIEVDLRKGDYDALLESAMFNTFSTNTLKVGTDLQSLTIEDSAADISQYRTFAGCAASTMNISIAPNQMVTTSFGIVGKDMTLAGSGATVDANSGNAPFDSYSGAITLGDSGGALSAVSVQGLDISVNNELAPTYIVGSDSTPQLEYGRATVEGNLTFYYEDDSILNRFINETESAFQVSVDDPTGVNSYTFFIPRAKFNGAPVPVANPQSRMVSVPFVGLYDSTELSNLVITRSA